MGILSSPGSDGLDTNISHRLLSTVEPNSFFPSRPSPVFYEIPPVWAAPHHTLGTRPLSASLVNHPLDRESGKA